MDELNYSTDHVHMSVSFKKSQEFFIQGEVLSEWYKDWVLTVLAHFENGDRYDG